MRLTTKNSEHSVGNWIGLFTENRTKMAAKHNPRRCLAIHDWHICVSFLWLCLFFLVTEWLYLESEIRVLKTEIRRESRSRTTRRETERETEDETKSSRDGIREQPVHDMYTREAQLNNANDDIGRFAANDHNAFHGMDRRMPPPMMNSNAHGQWGHPVFTNPDHMNSEDRRKHDEGWRKHSFNQFASDLIPVRRLLPDVAGPACRKRALTYAKDLPDVGVVIIFHNEAWSTLVRTVHSVLDRTPPHLLKEILLVDDFSEEEHLKERLDVYMSAFPKVRIIRATERQGLIRARLLGFDAVNAKVAMFLDSHCECAHGWLEPLLDRIVRDESTVAVPVADRIKFDTMEFSPGNGSEMFCGFEWDLTFNWFPLPERERLRRKDPLEPVRSATFLGCCFAISVKFFNSLGTYDKDFRIWGAEHLELSFKTWMCGGKLEIVPCSHVGHLFRTKLPFNFQDKQCGETVRKNNVRLAAVWMDNYKHFFHDRLYYENIDPGNVTERLEIRMKLKCKSFDWYLKNVYPELYIPYDSKATGMIKILVDDKEWCPESINAWFLAGKRNIVVRPCSLGAPPQHWTLTRDNQIRRDEGCLTSNPEGDKVAIIHCRQLNGSSTWVYNQNQTIYHNDTKKCLTLDENLREVVLTPCTGNGRQIWIWDRRILNLKSPDDVSYSFTGDTQTEAKEEDVNIDSSGTPSTHQLNT